MEKEKAKKLREYIEGQLRVGYDSLEEFYPDSFVVTRDDHKEMHKQIKKFVYGQAVKSETGKHYTVGYIQMLLELLEFVEEKELEKKR
jgi:hypothetical protein